MNHPFSPIIKNVGFACNCSTEYCFYRDVKKKELELMQDQTLETVIRKSCELNPKKVQFYWHGGEPILAGIDFYKKALASEEKFRLPGQTVQNMIQTNATLLDKNWAAFLKENNFGVSISLDGPSHIHNRYRRFKDGKGNFDEVMRGASLLREVDLPFGTVCVVTTESIDKAKELFRFFVDNKIYNINFIRATGRDSEGNLLPFSPDPDQFGYFLKELFDLWVKENNLNMRISPLVDIVHVLTCGDSVNCMFANECEWLINIMPNGELYTCNSEGMKERWRLGTIISPDLGKIEQFKAMIKSLKAKCSGCEWENFCRGGCICDYELEHPALGEKNILCGSLKTIFAHINKSLKNVN